jgi:sarcosine oxidase subunit gamma
VLHTSNEDAIALTAAFAGLGSDTPHSLVDISDRECAIAISGDQAVALLSTSCPRDLAAIPAGSGARTIFDTVPVILFKDSETEYRLECWRSYLPHVWGLLAVANRELAIGL